MFPQTTWGYANRVPHSTACDTAIEGGEDLASGSIWKPEAREAIRKVVMGGRSRMDLGPA
jgi:hypothetical protein